ncbi:MAG: TonB-dependent receptor [Gammaproteobacteria bacterium]|nr:TonB-dependent receptor [Gammaproteobacteria bacterium]NNC56722.1 TonB-dependent receptor [Woeseiaceae bacterium]NNL49665.1 TonB-dependent receptor [Woeseiaceae bacterium]
MIGVRQPGMTASVLLAAICIAPTAAPGAEPATDAAVEDKIEELVVTSRRRSEPLSEHAGNITQLGAEAIAGIGHQHVHELMTRIPGVWLGRGSGQEHLTAIRSPVLTGAGSCGDFLFLEDGIPIRPSGFCNVNQMFELHTEQASSIEVIRGPGSALYGSNALHGIVNVLTPATGEQPETMVAIEAGANEFTRFRTFLSNDTGRPVFGSLLYADDGGFRDDSGYRQGKLQLAADWALSNAAFTTVLSATDLDQQTAGFIFGEDAYKDPNLNRQNLNPEAFRDASSQRLYGLWKKSAGPDSLDIDVRPYLRHSKMRFLQHFLPGQPLEENGHVSAGVVTAFSFGTDARQFTAGVDAEWSDLYLKETQFGPTAGSDFLRETRPQGKHYDFSVQSVGVAPYLQVDVNVSERLTLGGGLRVEYLHYAYDNRMLDGNTRDDGTICGFGGCLYSRPASRSDTFTNVAPKLSFNYRLSADTSLYGVLARGFRAPQATELYRLQSGQEVADLDSESLDNLEFGVRWSSARWSGDAAVFAMQKRESVFRDSEGFNVSGGRSRHEGVEVASNWQIVASLRLEVDASFARHRYDFDTVAARGETFVSGNDVDSAPRWLGSAELVFEPGNNAAFALQWTSLGDYYLDAENRFRYPGHSLVNLRARIDLTQRLSVTARFNNLFDEAVADRADYAFGSYRYFPGRGRELFIELRYLPGAREQAR